MSRRLRRLPALILPLALATTLVACGGDDKGSDDSGSGGALKGVTITGDVGKEPKVTWDGELKVKKSETKVVTEGDGAKVKDGDQIQAQLWVGNGTTQETAYSTFAQGEPQTLPIDDQLNPVFKRAILGHTIGSRVAVTATAEKMFGQAGNAQMGIGNKDSVLLVVDLIDEYQPPKPQDVPQAAMPKVIEKGGKVTGLDFKGVAKPKADGDLLRTVVTKGTGATLTKDKTVTANYLGMVYGAKKPFDESYSKGQPLTQPLSQLVQGWIYGLDGLKVGSRVILQIPPSLGYGAQAQPGIPANSTLYFVLDIVDAK